MKHLLILAALLVAGGCGKKAGSAGDPAACATAADHALAALPAGMGAENIKTTLKGIMVQHCTTDKWSAEVVSCFENAKGMKDMKSCREKLPTDQRDKIKQEIGAVMMAQGGAMMGHPGMGGPGMGGPGMGGPGMGGPGMGGPGMGGPGMGGPAMAPAGSAAGSGQ